MEKKDEAIFIKAFNSGYELRKNGIDIGKMLGKNSSKDSEYQNGLSAGQKQFEQERAVAQMREKLNVQTQERFNMASKKKGRSM